MKNHRLLITMLIFVLTAHVSVAQQIKIVGQNVQNFFYSLDRTKTQDNATPISNYTTVEGRTAKLEAIVGAISPYKADIYAFNEVECCAEVMNLLAQSMSEYTGATYSYVDDGLTYDKTDPQNIGGVIKSGYIYNTATISPVGASVAGGTGFIYTRQNRFQSFKALASGETFTLSMNHFKAGSNESDVTARLDNAGKLLAALKSAEDPDILIMGDLNSMVGEACLNTIEDAGYEEQLLKHIDEHPGKYTHCWAGGEVIDHVYANSDMAGQVTDAEILPIANSCSLADESLAYSDHNPYIVTLNLQHVVAPTYSFVKATTVSAGKQYLFVADLMNGLKAAMPIAADLTYGYMYTQDVTEENNMITLKNMNNAFAFEDAGDGQFYIRDTYDRYLYQQTKTGGYYTTVAATTDKGSAHKYKAIKQNDGTFKVASQTEYYLYGTIYNNTTPEFYFTNFGTLYSPSCLPWLYEYDPNITPSSITEVPTYSRPAVTVKVVEQGRLVIKTPDGSRYNLQGMELR